MPTASFHPPAASFQISESELARSQCRPRIHKVFNSTSNKNHETNDPAGQTTGGTTIACLPADIVLDVSFVLYSSMYSSTGACLSLCSRRQLSNPTLSCCCAFPRKPIDIDCLKHSQLSATCCWFSPPQIDTTPPPPFQPLS